jgi:hypothetical protein
MYANTVATNVQVGKNQRQAVADGLVQLPYMKHQYMRTDRPNALLAEKMAAGVRSRAGQTARASSDLDRATNIQLQGEAQSQNIVTQGQVEDQKRFDTIRGAQMESNARVDTANTKTLGQNRQLAGEAFKNIHLINSNQNVAQNTALNNYLLSANQNIPIEEHKRNQKLMYEAMKDPRIKQAVDSYSQMQTEGYKPFEAQFKAEQARIGENEYPYKTFEESPYYTRWQAQLKNAKTAVDNLWEPIKGMQLAIQYQQPIQSAKKGGSLSKDDQLEIQRDKNASTANLKQTELIYKAILHNNEMLQKALIKVFK